MIITDYRLESDALVITTSTGSLRLSVISDAVMRVQFTGRAAFSMAQSLAVLPRPTRAPTITESAGGLRVSAGSLVADIDRGTGDLAWRTADGKLLVHETGGPGREARKLTEVDVLRTVFDSSTRARKVSSVDGAHVVTEGGRQVVDRTAYATTLRWAFRADEAIYGLGQHEEGILNYRGHEQHLYQQNMKVAIPVLLSTRGYAVMFDSFSAGFFTDGPDGASYSADVEDELDYYVVYGPEFDTIISQLRGLTGRVPMLPRWALGYQQSKERYTDAAELLEVAAQHRRRRIPLDCVIQDWKSWPEGLWGEKHFDPERYPDPAGMCAELHANDVRLMVSIWPNMVGDGPNELEFRAAGLLLGDDSTSDPRTAPGRELYWSQVDRGYFGVGVDGFWADCTEPFEADWHGAQRPAPAERRRINLAQAQRYLDPEQVSAYSLLHSRGLYEGQRATDPDRRVVLLTRSAGLGQQRYGTITWSGDISASWSVLRSQIAEGLSFCLTGNPRWNFDIGGFFVSSRPDLWFFDGDFPGGVDDLGYRELYVRWLQLGTFLPVMRAHGAETPREPWHFGEPGDENYDTIVEFIRLRYRLLPYLYSLLAAETRTDYTSLRALAFDFRADPAVRDIDDQFLLGPALLVCPVTRPYRYGPGSQPLAPAGPAVPPTREVYLPAGTDWYDFWTGRRYSGGRRIAAAAPLGILPLYVRAGSILPLGPRVEHSAASPAGPYELRVYPGADGTFELYDDAGDGYGYERGEVALTELRWDDAAATLHIGETRGSYRRLDPVPAGLVRVATGVGVGHDPHPDQVPVDLDGRAVAVELIGHTVGDPDAGGADEVVGG